MDKIKAWDEKSYITLKPSDAEIEHAIKTARTLMSHKMERWILDQLSTEQMENCIKQFQSEIKRREAHAALIESEK